VVRVPGNYLEPFTWSASVRYLSPTHVEVLAAERMPTVSEMRDLRRTLRAAGIVKATVKRLGDAGQVDEIVIED
jgi:hypothetical protein